jgi:hypothetical protein
MNRSSYADGACRVGCVRLRLGLVAVGAGLGLPHGRVLAAVLDEGVVGAFLQEASAVEDDDAVGGSGGAEAVGDEDDGAAGAEGADAFVDGFLSAGIERYLGLSRETPVHSQTKPVGT